MAATSSYIQIANYALLEYIYANETISTTKARVLRLYNNYSNEYQFINSAAGYTLTENVLDTSATKMGADGTRWAYLDVDSPVPVIQIDPNLDLVDVTNLIVPNIKYDRVKLHFLSGYDFAGIDGVILDIGWNQWQIEGTGGKNFTPASQVYLKGDERIQFATLPLFVGDRLYDRYIEFALPSLADANFDFWNSPTAPNTFGYQYTFNNVGFAQESQIRATLYEINSTSTVRSNRYFITGQSFTTSFNQSDLYSFINAVIDENPEYDYIEYYPTWNGQFLEDYIQLLNESGGDWVVVNQLDLYEQLGRSFVKTFSMTSLQDSAFNAPAAYRPIIRNSYLAISYTIEYTMRLLNKSNGQEIIRKATFTSTDPKKYGPNIEKINVLEGFRPVKVYNKNVKLSEDSLKTSVQYIGYGAPQVMTQTVYVNAYYDVNYISVDSTTDLSVILGQTVYPQGQNTIFINKFDNYIKFKIFTKSPDKQQNVSLDLAATGMNVKLAFILDDQSKVYLDPTQDMAAADPGAGEVLFRMDDTLSTKLLGGKQREYYIVNKNEQGDEILIYAGKFAAQQERGGMMSTETESLINQLDSRLTSISNLQNSLLALSGALVNAGVTGPTATVMPSAGTANGTSSAGNEALLTAQAEEISQAQESQTTVASSAAGVNQAIQQAANTGDTRNLNIPDVPGVTPFIGANINTAVTPNVVKPSDPASQVSAQSVSSSALDQQQQR